MCILYKHLRVYSFGITKLEALGEMANAKQVLCLILLVLLFSKLESRSLEAFIEGKKTLAPEGKFCKSNNTFYKS